MSAGGAVAMARALFYLVEMVLRALFPRSKLMYIRTFAFGSISGKCVHSCRAPAPHVAPPPSCSRPAFLQRFGVGQMQPAASLPLLFLSALRNRINI